MKNRANKRVFSLFHLLSLVNAFVAICTVHAIFTFPNRSAQCHISRIRFLFGGFLFSYFFAHKMLLIHFVAIWLNVNEATTFYIKDSTIHDHTEPNKTKPQLNASSNQQSRHFMNVTHLFGF